MEKKTFKIQLKLFVFSKVGNIQTVKIPEKHQSSSHPLVGPCGALKCFKVDRKTTKPSKIQQQATML